MEHLSILRSQTQIQSDLKKRMRDTTPDRWSDEEYYLALNDALGDWYDRVRVPHLHTLTDGFDADTYEYSLPAYIRQPMRVQYQRTVPIELHVEVDDTTTFTWVDVPGFDVEPDGSGGWKLRLALPPYTLDARIIWYAPNSRVPTGASLPTTSAMIDADATSLPLSGEVDIDETGHVKIDAEWMSYAGVSRSTGGTTTLLLNLIRELYGTTAASHSSGADVEWGVAAHRADLYANQLYHAMRANLHGYYIIDGASTSRNNHERPMLYYRKRADEYWKTYQQPIKPKMRLTRGGSMYL